MIRLCIPSKGRPDFIPQTVAYGLSKYIEVIVVVPIGEKKDCEKYMDLQVVECPEKGLPRTRNWILDNLYTNDIDYLMMMDDDIKSVLWGLWRKSVRLSPEDDYIKYMVGHLNIKKKIKFITAYTFGLNIDRMVKDSLLDSFNENIYGSIYKQLNVIRTHLYGILIDEPAVGYRINRICSEVEKLLLDLEWGEV